MSLRAPLTTDATSAHANGARDLRSDSAGSDDSGFGDDSIPPDEYIQLRLQKMNTLMGFGNEPGIDELAVTPASGATASAQLPIATSSSSSLSPPPPFDAAKKPALTPYERLQALSLKEGNASALQLVEDAASLPTPDTARFFGAQPLDFDYGAASNNRTFMADDDDDDDEDDDAYVITWEGGQLGLLFKANAAGQVVIRRVNKKGTALGLHCARAGDVLIGLNGISVQGVPFLEIIEQLKHPRFPLKLEFEPMKFNALPPSIVSGAAGALLPPPPPYNYSGTASAAAGPAAVGSPTSSAGTVEVTDQDASFVMVSRDDVRGHDDRGRRGPTLAPEYDVVWDSGPLGCGLKHRSGYPTVKTVSGVGVSPSVAQISAGDVLLIINGYKTHEIGFKSAITMLQRAPKPIFLRFRRQAPLPCDVAPAPTPAAAPPAAAAQPPLAPRQYHVLWTDGPLGIQIKSGSRGLVYVSRLTGAGNPAMTKDIAPGDIFVRIADVDVASRGIAGAFELLKTVPKPVVLVFEKPRDDVAEPSAPVTLAPAPAPASPSGPVPSFRKLREEEAAAAAARGSNDAVPMAHPHGITRAQSAGTRRAPRHPIHPPHDGGEGDLWQTRTAPYPSSSADATIRMHPPITAHSERGDLDYDSVSETGSQASNAYVAPPPLQRPNVPFAPASSLPRFSDIEAGRVVVTPELTALPPPPSYLDMFTQSGRSLDHVLDSVRAAPGSPLASESASVASDRHLPTSMSLPLPPPTLPPTHEADAFGALPPPPHYASFHPMEAPAPPPPTTRLQELRQQYIEAQRQRNGTHLGGAAMSPYSDFDDPSSVMRPHGSASPVRAPQPLPELWVCWSEGPLGITFKRKNGQIVVSRLTGAGFSPGIEQLRTGDWLVSFNNYSTENLRLSETMEMLKRLPKPIDMRFIVQS